MTIVPLPACGDSWAFPKQRAVRMARVAALPSELRAREVEQDLLKVGAGPSLTTHPTAPIPRGPASAAEAVLTFQRGC